MALYGNINLLANKTNATF